MATCMPMAETRPPQDTDETDLWISIAAMLGVGVNTS
jgi:hypothetical protein